MKDPAHTHTEMFLHEFKQPCKHGKTCRFLCASDLDHCLRFSRLGFQATE